MANPDSGFQDELELLTSMYPDEVIFNSHTSELTYTHQNGKLCLRLPSEYPASSKPEVISAIINHSKSDIRDEVSAMIKILASNEPILDTILSHFTGLVDSIAENDQHTHLITAQSQQTHPKIPLYKTYIIYLHHLLATSKRKQAITPLGPDSTLITGITKPGYPGVMVFSGPAEAVTEHVMGLKALRWQAFQVRYEGDERWEFGHGHGIDEVESMGEVVGALGKKEKGIFMGCMGMK
ncbi:hypothetical protein EJ08DRAFT_679368 [Tothia fuscella]|uniref:RWD domain-containing protein n=1 Tax=Tothia fuscella TaxID=1048955 RepID=A0A9P4NQX6_9PEZI|nr:hypothetical protein EJ08DRAFT_679368 [Tothia fuscella]